MNKTPELKLPYIMPSQAQKHVTHNEALRALDAIVQLAVISRSHAEPPSAPAQGDRYILPADASGAWASHAGSVAAFRDGAWAFHRPGPGWRAFVEEEGSFLLWDGTRWTGIETTFSALQDLALFGLGTGADEANPFAAKLYKALWSARYTAEGGDGDLRYTFNKEAPANTGSLLMQSGWSGRAEIGLAGDDDLHVKVSADGSDWKEAIVVDRASGAVRLPGGLFHPASGAPLHGMIFTPGGDGTVSIWRIDAAHAQSPRSAAIASVSGDMIGLTTTVANQFFTSRMEGVSLVRIWNTGKSPMQPAWIKAAMDGSTLQVTDPAAVAGWEIGETVQIGDPADITPGWVIALDISPMLENLFGAAFPQAGIMVKAGFRTDDEGDALSISPNGVGGSFVTCADAASAAGVTIIPCTEPSPISNAHLVFVREQIASEATVELFSSMAVFV